MTFDPFVLLTPLLLLPIVWLLRFVGCGSFGSSPAATTGTPPTILITVAGAGAPFYGGPLSATASATAATGLTITSIQFRVDGMNVGSPSIPVPPVTPYAANFVVDTSTIAAGAHKLTATAFDSLNQSSDSAPASFEVRKPKPLIQSVVPGPTAPRTDYTGFVGMHITVGAAPILVHALGRLHIAGNNNNHTVKLVDGVSQTDLPGAVATVTPASVPEGEFAYTPLGSPVTLGPGRPYFLVSFEENGKDAFLPNDTEVTADPVVTVDGPEYDQPWGTDPGLANHSYGVANLKYTSGS